MTLYKKYIIIFTLKNLGAFFMISKLTDKNVVVFKQRQGRHPDKTAWSYEDGNIIYTDTEKQTCLIIWLDGYKSRTDDVPFSDIVAVVDTNSEQTTIGPFTGHFRLLVNKIEKEPKHQKKEVK